MHADIQATENIRRRITKYSPTGDRAAWLQVPSPPDEDPTLREGHMAELTIRALSKAPR